MDGGDTESAPVWRGVKQRMVLAVYNDQITLPRSALRILSAVIQGTGTGYRNAWQYPLRNDWFQWLPTGPGMITDPPYDVGAFVDQGDGFLTLRNLPSAGTLKVYNSTTESAGSFHVRGISSGNKVYTGTGAARIEGENIAMPTTASTSTVSATTFDAGDSLYAIIKPLTNGVVTLYHVAGDATETLIGRYEPGEQAPNYRRYYSPQYDSATQQVVALVQRRQVDVRADNDEVVPGNLRALERALESINFERKAELERAQQYLALAIRALNAELEVGMSPDYGRVHLDRISGMGAIPNLI